MFLIVIAAIAAVLVILIVLVQNPKGGGFSSAFGGSQAASQLMGASRSTDVLEKITWGFASTIMAICLIIAFFSKSKLGTTPTTPTNGGETPIELPK